MAKPNWRNRTLFHGDNLKFLRAMNSESVDLIATDPPFKKGRDFHATPDSLAAGAKFQDRWSWERDVHSEWIDQIKDDHSAVWEVIDAANAVCMRKTKKNLARPRDEVGSDMGAFLCFMAVRLLAMHRVLKPTGSMYLHCDWDASHYLKLLMDAIFGKRYFRNEIIWCYNVGGKGKRWWARKHDVLLFYTKTDKYHFDGKAAGIARDTGTKSFGGKMGVNEEGRPYQDKIVKKTGKVYRYYLDEPKIPEDWWVGINSLQSGDKERYGYPTQKPLLLYQRIVIASSLEGNIVLDPFCGCATTPVVAESLRRQWVGIDIWDKAHDAVVDRLREATGLFGKVNYQSDAPERTDDGETAAPFLRVKERVKEPEGPRWTRAQMYEHLLTQYGTRCMGCDRMFDDPRYLELDHNTPRADGGINHITNRILLCGPCNKAKSNIYTLSGLRKLNKKNGWMANPSA